MSGGTDEARAELARLAAGLAATTRRRSWLGATRVPRSAAPTPVAPAAPPQPAPASESGADVILTEARQGSVDASATRAAAAACNDLDELRAAVADCTACSLCETRTQTVFQDGSGSAGVLFVGEAPGQHEDEEGVPFVGRAGALLTDIVQKGMGLRREEVAIANVLKCRPPGNRDPRPDEKALCTPYLDRQIELLAPRVVVTLGLHASQHVLASHSSMGRLRGKVHTVGGLRVVATYHPAFLLRTPSMKKACWQDIQLAMKELGLQSP